MDHYDENFENNANPDSDNFFHEVDALGVSHDLSGADKYHNDFDNQVRARALAEQRCEMETRKQAEAQLDSFYDERTDRMAHLQSTNRDKEDKLLADLEELKKCARENPWVRVCEMVDMTVDSTSPVSKMRSLLIQMKAGTMNKSKTQL